jgi:Asp-tRNA(Asn)/Glu-tRNA(Gln) amidotransferase A subunit family amidase
VLAPTAACAAAGHAAIGNAGTAGCVPRPPPLSLPSILPLPGARPLSGTRVGVYRAWLGDADPGVVASCEWGLTALQEAGAEVKK